MFCDGNDWLKDMWTKMADSLVFKWLKKIAFNILIK